MRSRVQGVTFRAEMRSDEETIVGLGAYEMIQRFTEKGRIGCTGTRTGFIFFPFGPERTRRKIVAKFRVGVVQGSVSM
jgi:hypothetical protein